MSQNQAGSVKKRRRAVLRIVVWLVLTVLLAAPAFYFLCTQMPGMYRAVAVVRRDDLAADRGSPAALVADPSPPVDPEAIKAEVLAWQNLDAVMAETKLDVDVRTPTERQAMYERLRGAIDVKGSVQSRVTEFIQFSAVWERPTIAQAIANSVANHFVERAKWGQASGGKVAIDFLRSERDHYHGLLEMCENELEAYRATHYEDLPEVKDSIRRRLLDLRIEQDTRELQLKDAQSRLEGARKQLAKLPRTVRADADKVTERQLQVPANLIDGAVQARGEPEAPLRTGIGVNADSTHRRGPMGTPGERASEQSGREDLREGQTVDAAYSELTNDMAAIRQEIKEVEMALRRTAAAENANEDVLNGATIQEKHYSDLLRNQKQYSQLYDHYWSQYEEAKRRALVQDAGYGLTVELYSAALRPTIPESKQRRSMAAISLGAGAVASLLLMTAAGVCVGLVRRGAGRSAV